jgi:aldose 1-epimerase
MTVPLTGTQYTIAAGHYRATVTALGAGLRELSLGERQLIAAYDTGELPPHSSGQLLTPWPNRIDEGHYSFAGTDYQLALSEPARSTAIHGLTRWLPWDAAVQEPDRVVLRSTPVGQQGYPFAVEVDAEYLLTADDGLRVTITARNRGMRMAPWGTGSHPYLTPGPFPVDDYEFSLPAEQRLPADQRGIPCGPPEDVAGTDYDFREPRLIGPTRLDHAFTGLIRGDDGRAWVRIAVDGTRLGLWADASYRWLQVFTSDGLEPERARQMLAVEPMTCPPNAFVSGDDLISLRPGETVTHSWGIKAFGRNEQW